MNDGKEVQIRFESKTLAGLEARIRKEDGKLKVRLNCDSDSVRQMLSGQTDALTQRLETRGYAGVQVQVQSQPRAETFRDSRSRSHSGQGQQQEQQKRQQR